MIITRVFVDGGESGGAFYVTIRLADGRRRGAILGMVFPVGRSLSQNFKIGGVVFIAEKGVILSEFIILLGAELVWKGFLVLFFC